MQHECLNYFPMFIFWQHINDILFYLHLLYKFPKAKNKYSKDRNDFVLAEVLGKCDVFHSLENNPKVTKIKIRYFAVSKEKFC